MARAPAPQVLGEAVPRRVPAVPYGQGWAEIAPDPAALVWHGVLTVSQTRAR